MEVLAEVQRQFNFSLKNIIKSFCYPVFTILYP